MSLNFMTKVGHLSLSLFRSLGLYVLHLCDSFISTSILSYERICSCWYVYVCTEVIFIILIYQMIALWCSTFNLCAFIFIASTMSFINAICFFFANVLNFFLRNRTREFTFECIVQKMATLTWMTHSKY